MHARTLFPLLALLPLALACNPTHGTKDTSEGDIHGSDRDGDGYEAPEDCDDGDPAVHPGADERCDGADNDCDDEIDEGVTLDLFLDRDGDGFGDPESPGSACAEGQGMVADATDCDDTNADTWPGAEELCDGLDNDCNGTLDDGLDLSTFYTDGDRDGFGDPASSTQACHIPPSHAENDLDCDDTRADVNPEAPELCDDVDNDCDEAVDEEGALGGPTWYRDRDHDGWGDEDYAVEACDPPEGYVERDGDCDDWAATIHPDALEVCDAWNTDEDCDGLADDEDSSVSDASRASWYVDADADGWGAEGSSARRACDLPTGYADNALDCDDGDPDTSPAADEFCDGEDDDCSGVADDDALDATVYYRDADGDGYGDPLVTRAACTRPTGYVATGTDCDDADASAWPGHGCGASAHDGSYTGTVSLVATVVGLPISDTCTGALSATMAVASTPDLRGSGTCAFTGPLAIVGSVTFRIDGNITSDPYIAGSVTVDSTTDTWTGAFSGDTLVGETDGTMTYGAYTIAYDGGFTLSR